MQLSEVAADAVLDLLADVCRRAEEGLAAGCIEKCLVELQRLDQWRESSKIVRSARDFGIVVHPRQ
jgi:hypothetical protein